MAHGTLMRNRDELLHCVHNGDFVRVGPFHIASRPNQRERLTLARNAALRGHGIFAQHVTDLKTVCNYHLKQLLLASNQETEDMMMMDYKKKF